tara:strand:+ start:390 stop:2132 length:1743 start_codon:yes stop_codon:yes gene_type:complete
MARTKVQAELIATNAISGTIIADNAITATHIATNSISGTLVQDGGIVTTMIAANNVTSTKIVTDAIQTRHIADDQVTAAKLANSINTDIATGPAALPKAGGTMTGSLIIAKDDNTLTVQSTNAGQASVDIKNTEGHFRLITDAGTLSVYDQTDSAERFRIDTSGNVGIGTNNPSYTLDIVGPGTSNGVTLNLSDAASSANSKHLLLTRGVSTTASIGVAGSQANDPLWISRSGGYDLMVASSGSVGIGTTTPDRLLDVSGTGNVYGKFQSTNATGAGIEVKDTSEDWLIQADGGTVDGLAFYDLGRSAYRMVIDDSGKVGIGTTTPDGILHLKGSADTYQYLEAGSSDGNAGILFQNNSGQTRGYVIYDTDDDLLLFQVNQAERMRIESTGDIRFGHTGAYIATDEVFTFYNGQKGRTISIATNGNASFYGLDMWNQVGGSCNQVLFRGGPHGATTGSITCTGNNATQYNTSSDYRLKENVDYTWDATTRLKQLKPVRFNWISDDTNTLEDGFLAHEVSSIVPNAVTGEKDAVYTEEEASSEMHIDAGDIKRQQLDHSKLVPLLVKTVQELEARIKTLEG